MDFDWDTAKDSANRRKHSIDFRTATKVFLDPHVVEFDDMTAAGEMRFNAIGRRPDAFRYLHPEGRGHPHHIRQRSDAA